MSRNTLLAAALVAVTLTGFATPGVAAIDVSVNIGTPGYYGPIDIRDFGRPQLIYSEPRVINRTATHREPVYLRVPPGHAKDWRKHCSKYNACGERVYFVQDRWYEREYVPRYQAKHNNGRDKHREDRHDDKHHSSDSKHDNKHDNKHNDHGKGHGKN